MRSPGEVRIGNIDVGVTDRNNNHVEGLTRDDFVIFENEKLLRRASSAGRAALVDRWTKTPFYGIATLKP